MNIIKCAFRAAFETEQYIREGLGALAWIGTYTIIKIFNNNAEPWKNSDQHAAIIGVSLAALSTIKYVDKRIFNNRCAVWVSPGPTKPTESESNTPLLPRFSSQNHPV